MDLSLLLQEGVRIIGEPVGEQEERVGGDCAWSSLLLRQCRVDAKIVQPPKFSACRDALSKQHCVASFLLLGDPTTAVTHDALMQEDC